MSKLTIIEKLATFAVERPNKKCWTFMNDKGEESESITFLELELSTDALATFFLTKCDLKKGQRVMLVFLPGLAFTTVLIACFKAGLVAVPVFPPDPSRLGKDLHHFTTIQKDCGADVVFTHSNYSFAKNLFGMKDMFTFGKNSYAWPALRWITIDSVLAEGKAKAQLPISQRPKSALHPQTEVAFLQYTSGSTSDPKGVMITHQNLAHNVTCQYLDWHANDESTLVSWLPQYHDMGLIGGYLNMLYTGKSGFYLSPISFLKNPLVWLKVCSDVKAVATVAPNFAFGLVTRKYKDAKGETLNKLKSLDLSSLRYCPNGAEPIDFEVLKEFTETFAKVGLQPGVIRPSYGLAEHTVFACTNGATVLHVDKKALENNKAVVLAEELIYGDGKNKKFTLTTAHQTLVSCGLVNEKSTKALDIEFAIVDPETNTRCDADVVGEIWISSDSRALGYWNKPELSREVFEAHLKGSPRTFVRTGDTGFIRNGELYFGGRIKDMIIINGANYYPQDIEQSVEQCHPSLRAGCSAAFAIKQASELTESVVLVVELKAGIPSTEHESIVNTILDTVSANHGLYLSAIRLLQTKTIEKTTSGKISRSRCRKAYLGNNLSVAHAWNVIASDYANVSSDGTVAVNAAAAAALLLSPEEVKNIIAKAVAGLMNTDSVATDQPLLDLGLNSLATTQLAANMSKEFGISVRPTIVFSCPTIDDIALHVAEKIAAVNRAANGSGSTASTTESAVEEEEEVDSNEGDVSPPSFHEAHIAGYGISVPFPISTERFMEIEGQIRRKLGQSEEVIAQMATICKSSRIVNRHYCQPHFLPKDKTAADYPDAVGTVKEDLYADGPSPPHWKRLKYFQDTCVKLSVDAARKAVENWGKDRQTITHLLTTCTSGWQEPGIACSVISELGLSQDVQKSELNFNGCFCGATCLRLARDIIRAGDATAVLIVACEVPSSQSNWTSTETEHMVAQSLFADGAAAMVVAREGIWRFSKSGSSIVPNSKSLLGLRPPMSADETSYIMTLSKHVAPSLSVYFTKGHGKDLVRKMYSKKEPLPALAIHPGGPRILEAVGDAFFNLGWKEDALDASYDTFMNYGNLGSAAMLFVLASRLSKHDITENKLITMAFGPGVTVEWAVLERASLPRSNVPRILSSAVNNPHVVDATTSSKSTTGVCPAMASSLCASSSSAAGKSSCKMVKGLIALVILQGVLLAVAAYYITGGSTSSFF